MTLDLILAADPDAPLSTLCRGFDFYDLTLALEDAGVKVAWDTLLAMGLCGDVQELLA